MAKADIEAAVARGIPRELLETFVRAPIWTLYSTKGGLADAFFAKAGLDEQLAGLGQSEDVLGATPIAGELRSRVWPAMLAALATDGEPARCFIPRHVIQAGDGDSARFVVFCFECNFLLVPKGSLIRFADSAGLEVLLNEALKAQGIMDSGTMRMLDKAESDAARERERQAYLAEMNRRLRGPGA